VTCCKQQTLSPETTIIAESKGGTFAFVCGSTSFPFFAAGVLCSLQCNMIFLHAWHYMHKRTWDSESLEQTLALQPTLLQVCCLRLQANSAKGGFLSLNNRNKAGLSPSETPWLSLRGSRYK